MATLPAASPLKSGHSSVHASAIVLRVDLNYVPWEPQVSTAIPAMALRLMRLAREKGWKLHGFIAVETARFLPSLGEALLDGAHDLDWLSLSSEPDSEFHDVLQRFLKWHVPVEGLALLGKRHPVRPKGVRWSTSEAESGEAWHFRSVAMNQLAQQEFVEPVTVVALDLPQLALTDPRLTTLAGMIQRWVDAGIRLRTLREIVRDWE